MKAHPLKPKSFTEYNKEGGREGARQRERERERRRFSKNECLKNLYSDNYFP